MSCKLLFLGCNDNQVSYLEILREQDWFILGVDINPNAPGKTLCDSFVCTGYDNLRKLIEIGKKEKFSHKDKIFTASAQFAHKGAAHFANYFKINYPTEKSIDLCLNKFCFYELFQKNEIPIPPTWYINNEKQLRDIISNLYIPKNYYLKSDYSKNPNYVYQFNSESIPYSNICWKRDKYFRNYYILQEEFLGEHLRINIYGNRYNVFNFFTDELTHEYQKRLESIGTITALKMILKILGLQNWLIKFDVILNGEQYVVLDIGMDPPFRMKAESIKQKLYFERFYLEHYLSGIVAYPRSLD